MHVANCGPLKRPEWVAGDITAVVTSRLVDVRRCASYVNSCDTECARMSGRDVDGNATRLPECHTSQAYESTYATSACEKRQVETHDLVQIWMRGASQVHEMSRQGHQHHSGSGMKMIAPAQGPRVWSRQALKDGLTGGGGSHPAGCNSSDFGSAGGT